MYSLGWLKDKVNRKQKVKYLMFWGHKPQNKFHIDSSCFSQWYSSSFSINGVAFKTAEHWMMYEKARLFEDDKIQEKILLSNSPGAAKALGREVSGFSQSIWDDQKVSIVTKGNYHKFSQNESLKHFLLNTGERVLVEASPVDKIWGIGLAGNHDHSHNPHKWKGQNLLGFVLMEVRDQLRNE